MSSGLYVRYIPVMGLGCLVGVRPNDSSWMVLNCKGDASK